MMSNRWKLKVPYARTSKKLKLVYSFSVIFLCILATLSFPYAFAEENSPPILESIEDRIATEGSRLTFILNASDPDGDSLTFSASGLPAGASFDPSTRTFYWMPSSGDAGSHSVTFAVSDSKDGADSETITVNVISKEQELEGSINALIQEVQNYYETGDIDNKGIKNSLISKLNAVKERLSEERFEPARNVLRAFINQLKAQSGKHISGSAASSLIEMTKAIMQMI
ncbi:MAG: Ig domain-containing protein [Candidatus Bathyarchaeia archaeon]